MNQYKPEGSYIKSHKNYEYTSSFEGLMRACEKGLILEGRVSLCDHNLDLYLDLGSNVKAMIPKNEVQFTGDGSPPKDIAILTRVGKTVCFKPLGLHRRQNGETLAILSRRAAQEECLLNYVNTLVPGDVIPAKVTHLESFGAFVDIGCGIASLLSIDCISVSRISHPGERLAVGENVFTVVKSVNENGRIYVSQKELLGSWEENAALFSEGQTVRGVIRSIESYGIFVELLPNLAGLAEYRPDVFPGQTAAVYIKSILPEKMKIKLIIIDTQDEAMSRIPPEYFIDVNSVTHIDHWQYSPKRSKKSIQSVF